MKLRFTKRAATELDEVLAFIDRESPQGAHRVKLRIQAYLQLLLQYPSSGRLTSKSQLRRAAVSPYPYLIFYRVTVTDVVIHGIRHSARRPQSMPK